MNRQVRTTGNIVVKPARRDGFGFGVKAHRLLAVCVQIAVETAAPAGK